MEVKGTDYDMPDLSSFADATANQRRLAEQFTRTRRCAVEDQPEARTVWLVVGVQQFCLSGSVDNQEEAAWTCWMLAKAIETIQQR